MKRVICLIQRHGSYRREAFIAGARKLGYEEATLAYLPDTEKPFKPDKEDLLITWNRYGHHQVYKDFEGAKAPILIAENGYMGKSWLGDTWYSLSLDQHNGAGRWPDKGPSRWRSFGYELQPYRTGGTEVVVLPQRGIGWPGVAMPANWLAKLHLPCASRVRSHPGNSGMAERSLEADLSEARAVVTWGSGAAIKALAMGIPAVYDMPKWIGKDAATHLTEVVDWDNIPHKPRERMFERLAWAVWRLSEIESGEAIQQLLETHDAEHKR